MNILEKLDNYLIEIIKGKSEWTGKSGKKKVRMGQDKGAGGLYYGEIKDEYGEVESATSALLKKEIDKWFEEHGIKNIKWK